jgi:uncharacterized protein YodC (DUF2158 family)
VAVIDLSSQIDRMRIASIDLEEEIMDLKPGDVVVLKSGGHPITVVEVNDDAVSCLWMGGEGDLFRETLPLAVLELAEIEDSEDEEGQENDNEEHEEDDEAEESPVA